MSLPSTTEVLIVGAGPTGLMLANQLRRHGVRPLLIDRHAGPALETRALGVQARTLEIYAHLGIAERAVELGTRAAGADMWVGGRLAARAPLGDIGRELSPYPFLLVLGQDDNERLLGENLRALGGDVQWKTELVSLTQAADYVSVVLKVEDGASVEVRADWVAGCDGAHSAVRRLNDIDFVGAPYEHVFFVADTRVTGPMVPNEVNIYFWRSGFHLFFPLHDKDHWRVVGIVPEGLRGRDDLDFEAVAPSVRREVGPTLVFQECAWFSTYRIHHRRAARFREGRCFLLGDAAHIHSPVGAQGMNTGLQDAYNLAWKLALVTSGQAEARLLDSYGAERVPVAERLLATTDRAFALTVSDRPLAAFLRLRVFPTLLAVAMRHDWARKLAFRTISQIGIRYPGSPLSQNLEGLPHGGPQAGDRFPWLRLHLRPQGPAEDLFARLDDTRFNLILVGQPPRPDGPSNDLVVTHCVPEGAANEAELARARIPKPSFYLLRPDGHIGLAGVRLEPGVGSRYLKERVGMSTPALGEGE
jgi:2-polyprenyl-6-methoxyphenol hydroxylase-like FAD-dependent oxidoreductase